MQTKQKQVKTASVGQASDLNEKIIKQGDVVRNLKTQKADKLDVDAAVKLEFNLELKGEYKKATGQDWKPGVVPPAAAPKQINQNLEASELNEKIAKQGDVVRNLKSQKADKLDVDAAVKLLLELKADYKKATGQDWKPGAAPQAVKKEAKPAEAPKQVNQSLEASEINEKIIKQGDVVRNLKSQKADKLDVDSAVKLLLELKGEYKKATGQDWKPGVVPPTAAKKEVNQSLEASEINEKIVKQGDVVRNLKTQKADKLDVDAAVKLLLELKGEYKKATGQDWKPGVVPPTAAAPKQINPTLEASELNEKIVKQGDVVRNLKSQKAAKLDVDAAVKLLLELKADYKKATGQDWKPGAAPKQADPPKPAQQSSNASEINEKIVTQGDLVRNLKSKKADKAEVDAAVKTLLTLKADYKKATGEDWKPGTSAPVVKKEQNKENMAPAASGDSKKEELTKKVNEQGEVVRTLKSQKAAKEEIDGAVKKLLDLKAEYKVLTGTDFPVAGRAPAPQKQKQEPKKPVEQKEDAAGGKKQTRLGLEAKKEENLPDWYSQVITKGEMIEYYDVSGCYILRPWSFAIWKSIKAWFDAEITKMGVKECYFPMFVSKAALEKEKSHIADFAPEVAWVTKSGDSDLAEPIAVRPTSETIMYPAYAKWIQSYRDLPIRLNQWNNVVRWEFKHPQPFLRTREFLWQEGHTAFANADEAKKEVLDILGESSKV